MLMTSIKLLPKREISETMSTSFAFIRSRSGPSFRKRAFFTPVTVSSTHSFICKRFSSANFKISKRWFSVVCLSLGIHLLQIFKLFFTIFKFNFIIIEGVQVKSKSLKLIVKNCQININIIYIHRMPSFWMPYRLLCNELALKRLRASAKHRVGCKWVMGRANEADFLDLAAVNRPLAVLISRPTSPLSALT